MVRQDCAFADIQLDIDENAPEITDFSVPDWGMPDDPSLDEDGELAADSTSRDSQADDEPALDKE